MNIDLMSGAAGASTIHDKFNKMIGQRFPIIDKVSEYNILFVIWPTILLDSFRIGLLACIGLYALFL